MVLAKVDFVGLYGVSEVVCFGVALLQLVQVLQTIDRDGEDGSGGQELGLVLHLQQVELASQPLLLALLDTLALEETVQFGGVQ